MNQTETGRTETKTTTAGTQSDLFDETIYEYDTTGNLPEDIVREFEIPPNADLSTLFMPVEEIKLAIRSPAEKAADMADADARPRFEGKVNQDVLDLVARYLHGIVEETKVVITEDGWLVQVADSANVAMFRIWIDAADFETYEVEREGVLGMPWKNGVTEALADVSLGTTVEIAVETELPGTPAEAVEEEFTDEFQLYEGVDLTSLFDMTPKKVESKANATPNPTVIVDDGFRVKIQTFDPKSARSVPDIPELELTSNVTLPGLDVQQFVKRADRFSDHISIRSLPDAGGVMLEAEGDSTSVEKEYRNVTDLFEYEYGEDNDQLVFEAETTPGDKSLFSGEYFKDLTTKVRKTDLRVGYQLTYGDEYPATIIIPLGDHGFIEFMLAPRIMAD